VQQGVSLGYLILHDPEIPAVAAYDLIETASVFGGNMTVRYLRAALV